MPQKRRFERKDWVDGSGMVIAATDETMLKIMRLQSIAKAKGHHGKCGRSEG